MNKGRVIRTQSPCRRGAYPHKQERVKAKLALSFTIPPLFWHRSGVFMGPNASNSWWGSGHAAKWLQDPLEMCVEKQEQKREEARKNSNIGAEVHVTGSSEASGLGCWVRWQWKPRLQGREIETQVMAWWTPSNLAPTLPPAQGRKEAAEPQAEHTAWCSQTFLHVADQSVSYHGGRDGWKLLSNSKSKKKMGMRMGKGKASCKQQDRGMLRE